MLVSILIVTLFTFQSAQSWSPECPHECWCHEASAASVADEWHPNQQRTKPNSTQSDDSYRIAICIQQHETQVAKLLSTLPPETEAIKILQAPDASQLKLEKKDFEKFTNVRALSVEGSPKLDVSSLTLHPDLFQALAGLQFLSLKHVELLEKAETIEKDSIELPEQPSSGASKLIYLVEEDDEIIPYEEFKKLNGTKQEPLWDGLKVLAELEYLFMVNCSLPEAFRRGHAFAGLSHLKEMAIRSSRLLVPLGAGSSDFKELEYLSLANNELLDVDGADLRGLGAIVSLDLSGNRLTRFTEGSLPALPDLESLDLSRNPIQTIYSNAFSNVPNIRQLRLETTSWNEAPQSYTEIQTGSFNGLNRLQSLWLGPARTESDILSLDYFKDLMSLTELHLRGQFIAIEADTFSSTKRLQLLDLKHCGLRSLSIDSFQGLNKLRVLDLSDNRLVRLPSGVFDPLNSLKELWLNGNELTTLAADVFLPLGPTTKMIRLERNPWHCTCELNHLRATVVNKVKLVDPATNRTAYNYERRVGPVCTTPGSFSGASVFDVMRKPLRCNKLGNGRPSVWVAPSEAVDHGAEAAGDLAEAGPRAEPSKPQQDYDDIIDHGEEVVDEPIAGAAPASPPSQPRLIKKINDVVHHIGEQLAPLKSSYYASLSKKAAKLFQEQSGKFKKTNQQ